MWALPLAALAAGLETHNQAGLEMDSRGTVAEGMKEVARDETEDEYFARLERAALESPSLAALRARVQGSVETSFVETAESRFVRTGKTFEMAHDAQGACGPATDRGCVNSQLMAREQLQGFCDQDAVTQCVNSATDELMKYYEQSENATDSTAQKICELMHRQVACVPATCCRQKCLACDRLPEDVREPDCSGVFSYKAAYYLMFQHAGWKLGDSQMPCLPRSPCARTGVSTSADALPLPLSQYSHVQITGKTIVQEKQDEEDEERRRRDSEFRRNLLDDVNASIARHKNTMVGYRWG